MSSFELAGKTVEAAPITFDFVADFVEFSGMKVEDIANSDKIFAVLRFYVAYCLGVSAKEAAGLIQEHMVSGGSLQNLAETYMLEVADSAFFQAFQDKKEEAES